MKSVAVQSFLDWVSEWTDIMKTWLTSLISLFLWQLPVSLSEEGRWQGVRGAGVVGSLLCEATYCLNCCHTRLVCKKGQVRHSGRNLFCPTAFFSRLNKRHCFASLTPVASAPSEHLPSVVARSVMGSLCFDLWPFFFFRRGEATCRHRSRHTEESAHPPVRRGYVFPGLHHRRGGSDRHGRSSATFSETLSCTFNKTDAHSAHCCIITYLLWDPLPNPAPPTHADSHTCHHELNAPPPALPCHLPLFSPS